jgi:single-stranded DNA-binding protein
MNICIFAGNFVRKPELRKVRMQDKEVSVINFSLAINNKYAIKGTNELKNDPVFIDCEAWDSAAETIARNCDKGDYIQILSKLRSQSYVDKDNNKRVKSVYRLERFYFAPGTKKHKSETDDRDSVSSNDVEVSEPKESDIPF